jgi:hypothetical protein
MAVVLALCSVVAGLAVSASPARADDWVYGDAVVINNSNASWSLPNDRTWSPCFGGMDYQPYASWSFTAYPTSTIAPGAAGGWRFGGPSWDGPYSEVYMCRDDAQRPYYRLTATISGEVYGACGGAGSPTPPDACTVQDGLKPSATFVRFGPKVDPDVVVAASGKWTTGQPVTLTAQLTFGSATGASLVPRGSMSFDLGPSGSGQCTDVPVIGRVATCQASFSSGSTQRVTASYAGDFQFLPGSGSTTVTRLGPLVQAPYLPSSGAGWESGAAFTEYPYRDVPGTPRAIAVSHDGKAMAAISSTGQLYARVDNPLQNPPPDFTPMYAANGQPMIASAATIDTNPVNGEVQLAVIGGDGRIWHRTKARQGSWSGWGSPGPDFFQATDVTLSIDNTGTAHVAAIGLDHNMNYRTRHPDGSWDGWQIVRDTLGQPVQATKLTLAAATAGAASGAVELDLIGYGTEAHRVFTMSKATGAGSWLPPREILVSSAAPFTRLAAGRFSSVLNGTATDIGLVVATTGVNAPVTRTLRTNTTWGDRANSGVVDSGTSGLAVSTTSNGQGIGFITWR